MPLMNQKIFEAGLSVETTSVYLSCCGLADAGTPVSMSNLLNVWPGTEQALASGLEILEKKNIVRCEAQPGAEETMIFEITAPEEWT